MSPLCARPKRSCNIAVTKKTVKTRRQLCMVEKGEIFVCLRPGSVAGAPNDASCKNNTHIPGISLHHFPKNVAVWPKWTRFDRRDHQGDFTPQCRRV